MKRYLVLVLFALNTCTAATETSYPPKDLACSNNQSSVVFHCTPEDCVPAEAKCNGVPDCPNGEDETIQECGCLANEFSCSNSCVALVKRCDRNSDCANGEDEQDCKSFLCPTTHFKCNNHFCIPQHAVCDFLDDCGDGSDEIGCPHRPCWHMEFSCQNGRCVRPVSLCDGQDDCLDGSDEADCGPDAFVKCADGSLVHRYQWCDDRPDCEDNHADELNCGPCNSSSEFACPNGRCIQLANVCDSQCDCLPQGSDRCADELGCDQFYTVLGGLPLCRLSAALGCSVPEAAQQTRCIRPQFICDSHNDCYHGDYLSDEFGCEKSNDVVTSTFRCLDNRTLPDFLRCDFKYDCLHGDDEKNCNHPECSAREWRCGSGQCIPLTSLCDLRLDCYDKTDEINCSDHQCGPKHRKCTTGQCLPRSLWCDFFPDCPDASDETRCLAVTCDPDQFRCDSGQCIPLSQKCYLSGNPRDGCADRSHLKHCRDWECVWDGQFKCQGGPCVNRSMVCDLAIDCKGSWDDEDGCPFTCSASAPQCECRDVHINCTGRQLTQVPTDTEQEITWFYFGSNFLNKTLNNETFLQYERLLYLDLSNNHIRVLPFYMFRNQWRLSMLDLRDNLLTSLANGSFLGLTNLKALHLQGNRLEVIHEYAFYGLYSLISLNLQGQRIHTVKPEAFVGLHSLAGLDLSRNKIVNLLHGTLRGMPALLFLNISRNRISVIEPNVFRSASRLENLETDEFRFCCLARSVSCLPPPDEFSSCEDLMSNLMLRLCVWLLAGVAIVGNLLVIVWRTRYSPCNQVPGPAANNSARTSVSDTRHLVHSFLITNLALGDLIMGSYLLLIAVVDCYYRGVYFIHDSAWKSSKLCSLAGFLSTFSSELSVFTLTVITLDRFLVIIFPFRVCRLDRNRTRRLMTLVWILAAVLSALPLAYQPYFQNFYGRSGVCLALHITPDKPNGWQYSVFVFLFLNSLSFTLIALGYLLMFIAARTTRLAVSCERRTTESAIAWRMTLLVSTDAACWVPIIILGLASLAGFTMPPQVFAWVAVFVLPLNAALNPVLYTLSTAPFLNQGRNELLTIRRSYHLSRKHYSTTKRSQYGDTKSDNTCYSLIKWTSDRRPKKVDTVINEDGEVVALNQLAG